MKQNKAIETMASVTKFPTSMSAEKAFLVFLSNLYYSLECNDSAFLDMLTNAKSGVKFTVYSSAYGNQTITAYDIKQRLKDFNQLGHEALNKLYKDFVYKNEIQIKKVG